MRRFIVTILSILTTTVYSQELKNLNLNDSTKIKIESRTKNNASLRISLGTYFKFDGGHEWITSGFEFELQKNKILYSLDYYKFQELHLFGSSARRTQIGFKIGEQTNGHLLRFKYQAGIAYYKGENEGYHFRNAKKSFSTVGLTTKVGLEFMPLSFLSIGIDLETNFNSEESIYMPLLKIGIGRIRPKPKTNLKKYL